VLEGSVDVAATIVDAAADRLEAGAVLRSRGTIASVAPVRIVGASEQSRVATWDQQAVTEAFRTCPWVEDELRVAGDRLQALVGITMGPLGDRLDPAVRADVASRLRLHTLGQYEVLAVRGGPIPGFLVVGAGELELLGEDGAPNGSVVRPGEFLFPNESLRASPAPHTVRAAKGGALVLLAERGVAQELIVTCPPLLEIFAAM
jgi:CRP-like cAMP-binding protein